MSMRDAGMRFSGLPSFGAWTAALHGMVLVGLTCALHIAARGVLVVMRYRARKRGLLVE